MSELVSLFSELTERSVAGVEVDLIEVERRAGVLAVRQRRRSLAGALVVVLVVALGVVAVIRPPDHDSVRVGGVDGATTPATTLRPGSPEALAAIVPTPARPKPVRAVGTVVTVPGQPLRLCFQAHLEQDPPACDGLPLSGDLRGLPRSEPVGPHEGVASTGTVTITGMYDGSSLRSTQPVVPGMDPANDGDWPIYTACPEPPGGWRAPTRGTPADADRVARSLPGYDSSRESAPLAVRQDVPGLRSDTDPNSRMVLIAFLAPAAGNDAAVRAAYDGPVCIVSVRRPHKEALPAEISGPRPPPGHPFELLDEQSAVGPNGGVILPGGHFRIWTRYADRAIADWLRAAYPDRPFEFELVPYLHPLS